MNNNYLLSRIYDNFLVFKSNRSDESKSKDKLRVLINDTISNKFREYSSRYNVANSLIKLEDLNYRLVNKQNEDDSIIVDNFDFTKEMIIEHPLEYFVRIFDKYVSGSTYPHKKDLNNVELLLYTYCTDIEKYVNESKNLVNMDRELLSLDLKCEQKNGIYYKKKILKENLQVHKQIFLWNI